MPKGPKREKRKTRISIQQIRTANTITQVVCNSAVQQTLNMRELETHVA
uniref:Uncharacterized protein n=1 Tax=Rhizophora mucronata TaxID=61149 RepID=A0A2P2KPN6_RHIMU